MASAQIEFCTPNHAVQPITITRLIRQEPSRPNPHHRDSKPDGNREQNQVDDATLLSRSNLPGLIHSNLPFLVSVAELDPPAIIAFAETFRDELCKANRCPTYVTFKDHSHISEVMSPDTEDTSVTGPILEWMKSVK